MKEAEYKLKQISSDFVVEEVPGYDFDNKGDFILYKMTKENLTTFDAIKNVSDTLHIAVKDIGYAGLKDKHAITVQYITIKSQGNRILEENYIIGRVRLERVGFRKEKLFPGCLESNNFEIVIRNILCLPNKIDKMINFFGDQRFSSNNVQIGRSLLKRDFKGARDLIVDTDKTISGFDSDNPNVINVLQKMDQKVLSLYVHAFQSYVWNKSANEIVKFGESKNLNLDKVEVPLIGYDISCDGLIKEVIDKALSEEGIKIRDLIVRELPNLSLESGNRRLLVNVNNLTISGLEDDDINFGMKKCKVSFNLPKASYGTICIKQMF